MNSAGTRPLSASEIAALTGGRLVGPGTVTVAGIAPLERAGPGDLSFLAAPRYVPYFQRTSASVVLVAPSLESSAGGAGGAGGGPETRVIGDDPYAALLVGLPVLYPQAVWEAGGRPTGSDGFGYIPGTGGEAHRKIPHVGRCLIGDDIEIGANTCVDRGSVDDTVIGSGTKIDNLVHIAHNVRIGARCLIMAQAGIAGSVQVEDDVIIGGQAGISDHLTIGHGARLLVQSGTIADIPAEATYFGTLAHPHREFLRSQLALYRLAKIVDDLERLVQSKAEAPPAVTER